MERFEVVSDVDGHGSIHLVRKFGALEFVHFLKFLGRKAAFEKLVLTVQLSAGVVYQFEQEKPLLIESVVY